MFFFIGLGLHAGGASVKGECTSHFVEEVVESVPRLVQRHAKRVAILHELGALHDGQAVRV